MSSVLVVGGTGPTGFAVVEKLLARGDTVTVLHTGSHERTFSGPVEHLHADPRQLGDLRTALGSRTFDSAVSTSGRLRHVVATLSHRVETLAAVTGLPAYAGWRIPPGEAGYPVPLRESDPPHRALGDAPGDSLTALVQDNERGVLDAAQQGEFRAAVVRYTMVYGPYSYVPFEWYFVRRALDGRRRLALEADGVMLPQRGYADNLAAAVLLVLDTHDAHGRVFNVGDEQVISVRAIAETIADALDHEFEMVPVPLAASPCDNPLALRQNTMFDLASIRELGYRDEVPVLEATYRTAQWLASNPVPAESTEEQSLGPRAFDYHAEDRVIDVYARASNEARRCLESGGQA